MAVHVGIIDQDPIRLITPLLDNRTVSSHIVFIGDKNSRRHVSTPSLTVLKKRDITSEFFEIPTIVNTSVIKESIQNLSRRPKGARARSQAERKLWPKTPPTLCLRSISHLSLADFRC